MASILKTLKEQFGDLYELLKKNQGENGLIFLVPNPRFYSLDSLNDKSFYYSHIFKKSNYDPTLYVNFLGKVMKSLDGKRFTPALGFKYNFAVNVKESRVNEDGIQLFSTDGICIDEQTQISIIGKEVEANFEFKKCDTSEEYLKYYNNEQLKDKKFKKYIKAKSNLEKFVYSMKNNNILMKGYEDSYSKIFNEYVGKLISIFTSVFKSNDSSNSKIQEIIAKEYVDSFVYKDLYNDIMTKLREFYSGEEEQLNKKLKENISKFDIDELKLPNSIANCDFSSVYKNLKLLGEYKTSFEKTNFLLSMNETMINEAKRAYEKETGKNLEIQGDFMQSCWVYIIAHSGVKNLIAESLFFKLFQVKKGYGENEYIINNFVVAVEIIKNELLRNEKDINVYMVKPFIVQTQE
jgi:hypothetical protein